jgi:hypothetical protein
MEDDSEGERGARPEPIGTWDEAEDFEGDDLEFEGGVKLERRAWDDESDELGGVGEVETPELMAKRRAGQKKAEEREFMWCLVSRLRDGKTWLVALEGLRKVERAKEGMRKRTMRLCKMR